MQMIDGECNIQKGIATNERKETNQIHFNCKLFPVERS